MCFKKAVAKSSRFSRIFAFGLMIFSGAGLINLCTVCAETTDELQGPPVADSGRPWLSDSSHQNG